MDTLITADVVATAPRFRRKSSTFVDAIHDMPEMPALAPAQLYSTESGRLFHSGRIVIITVGLPARGKTSTGLVLKLAYFTLEITDELPSVLAVNYQRITSLRMVFIPSFKKKDIGKLTDTIASASSVLLRQKIVKRCREDIYHFLNHENGQIAIYDAVNPLAAGRISLSREFAKQDIEYVGWDSQVAVKDYLARISARIPLFETMQEQELNYIKMFNAGEKMMINNRGFGYLHHRIVFYLLNLHIKNRRTYFVRAGTSTESDSYKADSSLSSKGEDYARKMTDTLMKHREEERKVLLEQGEPDPQLRPLIIWSSTRRRSIETAQFLRLQGYKVRHRSQMSQLNPGVCEKMSEEQIRKEYPDEVEMHDLDPYHHRYPRAESYHDLAVRLEPVILELEREQNDLLIIAHESVLRVLYGYLMACNSADIPFLSFPRDQIIEIIPASYNNQAKRIHIPDLPPEIVPGSPEDIKIPVPPSGIVSPMPGGGLDGSSFERGATPQLGFRTPKDPEKISQHHAEDVV
ncbi:hypothetical protein TRV_05412 [Trichophyton verrucosum HKI 0517]|uniref:6-phosphofructo-2-kinase domain-containing protein n=1 Tax=Trichophyton verrucosum (strain HKI 0517) TaxID=663202 RepID=D4DE48_TRIVH|nr:uncharacterized protein TRV_05412 [Trichophyton verrucosum HKI 0517]EFE39900.1 hypothetical protein TRV_05412 [Trichophyton verrucosum HKI 0517]